MPAPATSAPSVTDPRDGTAAVTGGAVNMGGAGLLLEDGSGLLLEDGSAILLEDGT